MRTQSTVWGALVLIGLIFAAAGAWTQPAPFPDAYAIVGARVVVGDGKVIEKGTVVVRDGLIAAVGAEVTAPPDAEVVRGDGMVVYPGFVDAYASRGLRLPEWQPNQDVAPDISDDAPPFMREANRKGVRPELRAADYLALADDTLTPYHQAGFTTALLAPSGGTINGVGALVNLNGLPKRDAVVRPTVAMHVAFETSGGGYPGSLMGIFAQLRQTLLDAQHFHAVQAAFARGAGRRPPADDTLQALQPVLDGTLPVLFDASSENQIRRALKLADEFGLKLILGDGAEAWKVAPELAKRQIPVLLSVSFGEEPTARSRGGLPGAETAAPGHDDEPMGVPTPRAAGGRPEATDLTPAAVVADRRRAWQERIANAAKLREAGVTIAFTTQGERTPSAIWPDLRRAVEAGLPKDAALRALTLDAARLFGVELQMGTVETGKLANLVVMSAEFTDPQSQVRHLFVEQKKYDFPASAPDRTGGRPATATAPGNAGAPAGETATEQPVELDALRKPTLVTKGNVFIKGGTILTAAQGIVRDGAILVRDGKIAAIGKNLTAPPGVPVIDATGKFISPGIIDAHSHIALDTINESTDNITAEVRIHDVINPRSLAIYRGLAGGVTSALLLHGSANVVGGQSAIVKMKWQRPVEELEAVLRRGFEEARRYTQAWERYEKQRATNADAVPPRRDLRLETLAEVLQGKILVHCHAYRADEMLMLLRLSKEYGFKIAAFQHALEAYKIAPEIAAQGVGISTFSDMWAYKMEAYDAIPYNAALCLRAGVVPSINSDDAERMRRLNLDAAKSIRYGALDEEDALKLVTLYAARQLGIAQRTGSLETGKDADIAIWEGHPLSVYSRCVTTLIEGEVYFQRRDVFGLDKTSVTAPNVTQCRTDHLALPTPPAARAYAIVGATVHPISGADIPNGTVVVESGRIQAVGAKVTIPKDAFVVQARGLHVYPGLIDAGTQLGLGEVSSVRGPADGTEMGDFQPDLTALTAVNSASEHFAVTRFTGITTALTRPAGGFVAGQSAVIHLAGWTPDEMKIKGAAALHVTLPEPRGGFGGPGGGGGFRRAAPPTQAPAAAPAPGNAPPAGAAPPFGRGGRRFGAAAPAAPGPTAPPVSEEDNRQKTVRDFFERAKRYVAAKPQAPDMPYDPRLEAMAPYVTGKLPVVFHTNSPAGIRAALRFAEELGLKPIIAGGADAWKVAELLASKQVPVIYGPVYETPTNDYDPYDTKYAVPALLQRAGVKLCFQSASSAMARDLPYEVGIACAYGLPHDAALKAVTLQAAEILGVADQVGSLEPGKLANLIVTDGDPLEIATSVHNLFIAGKPVALESKHSRQYVIYKQRLGTPKPNGTPAYSAAAPRGRG